MPLTSDNPDWRLQTPGTYSIGYDLNVDKCRLANILEILLALNSYQCHSCKSMHVENTPPIVVAMDLVSTWWWMKRTTRRRKWKISTNAVD